MLHTHVLMTFQAIKQFPGEDLDGLARRIHDLYGENIETFHLTYGEEHLLLLARIRELECVVERSGKYFFDPAHRPYSDRPALNIMIEQVLQSEGRQAKQRLLNDCENYRISGKGSFPGKSMNLR